MRSDFKAYQEQKEKTEKAVRRDFELKFNSLIKAAEEFSKAYNAHNGQVWPQEKAEALRRAMAALQKQAPFHPER